MGINAKDLRLYVVRPTLQKLNLWSDSAENLLIGTAAQESQMGEYLHQVNGIALGIYQMEPATHASLWNDYLAYHPGLKDKILQFATPNEDELIWNLAYATAMARIRYYWISEPLPAADDIAALGLYYKKYYNTALGEATVQEFINNYKRYVDV